jgi:hypothetical protein
MLCLVSGIDNMSISTRLVCDLMHGNLFEIVAYFTFFYYLYLDCIFLLWIIGCKGGRRAS